MLHCLLIDSGDGLILVDAGYGTKDIEDPTPIVKYFNKVIGLKNDIEETALYQIRKLGYEREDVKHPY